MSDIFGSTTAAESEVTIPVEGEVRPQLGAGVLPTERAAAVMVLGALVFLAFLRGAFRGALGD